ncbi:MAG: MoxR family ATPase [Acidimicrobiales bacterium]|nr:MoxR family ATPase [Acidimicrobiales bacterium]RZV45662.1 MAG: MoxR family ATPase [Acidimicrobiales bacterium]
MTDPKRAIGPDAAADACTAILDALETVIVGKRSQLELILSGLLANGHMLLEDLPGLGKTLIARSLAQVTGLSVGRVQFTPDLMPADVTGSLLYDQRRQDFDFRPGPIFNNVVLGDEINRAPPKTQAALLEAMQERQVTVDGESHPLPAPFIVLATQNPIEFEGTYPLPEAQIDRFLLRTSIGYPSKADDAEIIRRRLARRTDSASLTPVADRATVLSLQAANEDVVVSDAVIDYCVSLVHATRQSTQVSAGASPRGVEALVKLARARAVIDRRRYTTPDDVKAVAVPALAHRIVLRPEMWVRGGDAAEVVGDALDSVPTPTTLPTDSP